MQRADGRRQRNRTRLLSAICLLPSAISNQYFVQITSAPQEFR
jgi:hypothetical protein